MTAQSDLAAIRKIVENTDEHRTRARREAWDAIKAVLSGPEPASEEETADESSEADQPGADAPKSTTRSAKV